MQMLGKIELSPRTIVWRLIRAIVILYVVLFTIQRYLVFPAYMANSMVGRLGSPSNYNLTDFREVTLTDADGIHVMAWSHAPAKDMPIILYFHGNGSIINMRSERYKHFIDAGYGVFALSFRGYGRSEGSPSEEGLYEDARSAIAWLKQNYPATPIILYGESLGTGVAAEMAKEKSVYGVVLQSAYTSIADVAAETYWFLPGTYYLVRDRFDSLSKIPDIKCPILIIHGDHDTVIPITHAKKLAAAATSREEFITVSGAGHMNIADTLIITAMKNFFAPQTIK